MSASRKTAKESEYDEENNEDKGTTQTPIHDQGEEGREMNAGNRRVNHIQRSKELVQISIAHRYFKGDTLELGAVLGLLSKKLDIGTYFDKS